MHQREYILEVKKGDTVYINTRSKRAGQSAVVLEKGHRSSLLKFEDGHKQWLTFYSIERELNKDTVKKVTYVTANNVGNVIICPHCKRVLFDYKNTILDIEMAYGMCKFCHTKVKWDLRAARKEAGV